MGQTGLCLPRYHGVTPGARRLHTLSVMDRRPRTWAWIVHVVVVWAVGGGNTHVGTSHNGVGQWSGGGSTDRRAITVPHAAHDSMPARRRPPISPPSYGSPNSWGSAGSARGRARVPTRTSHASREAVQAGSGVGGVSVSGATDGGATAPVDLGDVGAETQRFVASRLSCSSKDDDDEFEQYVVDERGSRDYVPMSSPSDVCCAK